LYKFSDGIRHLPRVYIVMNTIRKIGYTLLSRHFYIGITVGISIAVFLFPSLSLAYTYSREPSGNGTYDTMTFEVDASDLVGSCDTIWNLNFHTDVPSEFQSTEDFPVGSPIATFTENFSNNVNVVYVFFSCDRASEPQLLEGDGSTVLWTTTPYTPPPEPPATTTQFVVTSGNPIEVSCTQNGTTSQCVFTYATSSPVTTQDMFYLTFFFLTGAGIAVYLIRKLT